MDEPKEIHPSDDELERYYMGLMENEAGIAQLEEHLLTCQICISRAEAAQDYVDMIRIALMRLDEL
ncbi:MAG: hypothetical protein ABI822_19015 [Bryobacteraceae bacterium]